MIHDNGVVWTPKTDLRPRAKYNHAVGWDTRTSPYKQTHRTGQKGLFLGIRIATPGFNGEPAGWANSDPDAKVLTPPEFSYNVNESNDKDSASHERIEPGQRFEMERRPPQYLNGGGWVVRGTWLRESLSEPLRPLLLAWPPSHGDTVGPQGQTTQNVHYRQLPRYGTVLIADRDYVTLSTAIGGRSTT